MCSINGEKSINIISFYQQTSNIFWDKIKKIDFQRIRKNRNRTIFADRERERPFPSL